MGAAWREYWAFELFMMWDRTGKEIPISGRIQRVELDPDVSDPLRTLAAAVAIGILEGEGSEHPWPEE